MFGMGYRIVYFYARPYAEEGCQNLTFAEREFGEEEGALKVFACGMSERYVNRGGQAKDARRRYPLFRWWKRQREQEVSFFSLMQEYCARVSADACYLEERFARELEERGISSPLDRQRMCGALIRQMCGGLRAIESILYMSGETEGKARELPIPEGLLRGLRYFFYMGERDEDCAVLEENLWREYGMPLLSVGKMTDMGGWQIGRLLVIDDRQGGAADWERLSRGSVYLDLWSDAARRAQMERNRADVKYLSEYLYLQQNLSAL